MTTFIVDCLIFAAFLRWLVDTSTWLPRSVLSPANISTRPSSPRRVRYVTLRYVTRWQESQ